MNLYEYKIFAWHLSYKFLNQIEKTKKKESSDTKR